MGVVSIQYSTTPKFLEAEATEPSRPLMASKQSTNGEEKTGRSKQRVSQVGPQFMRDRLNFDYVGI